MNQNYGQCYHTAWDDPSPTWMLILDNAKPLQRFVIYNRGDCCADRLKNFKLELFDNSGNIVWIYNDKERTPLLVYSLPGIKKDLVKSMLISATYTTHYNKGPVLTLCEVQVFGECAPGKWGLDCNQTCPGECKTWCHQDSGECLTCLGNGRPPECNTISEDKLNTETKCTSPLEKFGIGFGSALVVSIVMAVSMFLYIRRSRYKRQEQDEPKISLIQSLTDNV